MFSFNEQILIIKTLIDHFEIIQALETFHKSSTARKACIVLYKN